jgi:multiple sugar transport system ATP-binding protein
MRWHFLPVEEEKGMSAVELIDVCKSFGPVDVVKHVNFKVNDGEFLVLVGPSGCGKTTLLRLIAGLEEITAGDLCIGDRVVNKIPPKDRDIAMVFQSYALYPHMTVRRNLAFGLEVRKTPREEIDRSINEVAKMLDLAHLLDRLPKQLSGGQRQRVAMGRAIVRRPRVYLFDEPLSNLDAKLRSQMRVELKRLHQKVKTTIIYVTHDQIEAMTLADRIVVLKDGIIQQIGSPDELYYGPANIFVAGFIGSPAMNFLDGRMCVSEKKGWTVEGKGFHMWLPQETCENLPPAETEVIVGIRPHDLAVATEKEPIIFEMKLEVVEPTGWDAHLHLEFEGQEVIAQINTKAALKLKTGEKVRMGIHYNQIHLFDGKSKQRISKRW